MTEAAYRSPNHCRHYMRAARTIAGKIAELDGIVGILATGCLGRGHCDEFSDLDLVVYVDEPHFKKLDRLIAVGGIRHGDIELDTPVESYARALRHRSPSRYWSQVMRWDRANSKILLDVDGKVARLLKAKLVFPDWEQRKLMKKHEKRVADRLVHDYALWEKRGRPVNLARTLMQAAEHIILWIYARHKRFEPYTRKWLFYHLETGAVPEARHFRVLKRPFTYPVGTIAQARRIRQDLVHLCDRIGLEMEYRSVEDLRLEERRNWDKAPERTRHYLSW